MNINRELHHATITRDEICEYEQEIVDLTKNIETDSYCVVNYTKRGKIFNDLGRYEQALQDYSKAIEFDPKYADAYKSRGDIFQKLGQYKQAIQDYSKAIELNPNCAPAYNNRGNTFIDLHRYEEALREYSKAIEIDPNSAPAYNNRSNAYGKLRQYEQALQDCSKAIEINPRYAIAYISRGNILHKLGRYEEAIQDYSIAIEIEPIYTPAYNNRAKAFNNLGQHKLAIQDYSKVIEINPKHETAYLDRGIILDIDQYEKAIQDYSKAIEINPNFAVSYFYRGNSLCKLKKYEEAIHDYSKAIEIDSEYIAAYNNRGNAFNEIGKYKESFQDYSKVIEIDPNNVIAHNNRGTRYSELKKYKEALQDYSKAIEIDSKYINAYHNKGNVFKDLGRYEHAIQEYSKAIEIDPTEPDNYFTRGYCYQKLALFNNCYTDYCTFTYLCINKSKAFKGNLLHVIHFFEFSYPKNIVTIFESFEITSLLIDLKFNERNALSKIHHFELLMDFFEESALLDDHKLLNFKSILHYYLGGSISSYVLFDKEFDNGKYKLTSQELFYYALSSTEINLTQEAVIEKCIRAVPIEKDIDNYYLAHIYLLKNDETKAIDYFKRSDSFIFSQLMLIYLIEDDKLESDYLNKFNSSSSDNYFIINNRINNIPSDLSQFELYFHLKECEEAIEYLDLNYNLSIHSCDRTFWETYYLDKPLIQTIEGKLKEAKINRLSERIKARLIDCIGDKLLNNVETIQKLENVISIQPKKISKLWYELNNKSSFYNNDFEQQLGLEIEAWEIDAPDLYFLFIQLCYLKNFISQYETFTLFMYLINTYSEKKQQKLDKALIDLLQKSVDLGRTILPNLVLKVSLGSIKNLIPFLQTIFEHEFKFREVSNYQEFKANLGEFLSSEKDTLSENKFINKYEPFEWINNHEFK